MGGYWLRIRDFFEVDGEEASSLCPERETSFLRNLAKVFLEIVPVDWELFFRPNMTRVRVGVANRVTVRVKVESGGKGFRSATSGFGLVLNDLLDDGIEYGREGIRRP